MTFDFRPGPTVVGGSTTGNTIWTVAGSPYVIDSSLTVSATDTLTIEPGVIIKFKDDRTLTVRGTLVAEGAPGDSIVFTSFLMKKGTHEREAGMQSKKRRLTSPH